MSEPAVSAKDAVGLRIRLEFIRRQLQESRDSLNVQIDHLMSLESDLLDIEHNYVRGDR